jgi:hypothetical protein
MKVGTKLRSGERLHYLRYQKLLEQHGNRIIEIVISIDPADPVTVHTLPKELLKFSFLEVLRLENFTDLTSWMNIPPQITALQINSELHPPSEPCPKLLDFTGFPKKMPNLGSFYALDCPVISLRGLPLSLPKCRHFELRNSRLMTAEDLPDMPILQNLILSNSDMRNYAGLSTYLDKQARCVKKYGEKSHNSEGHRQIPLISYSLPISMHGLPPTYREMSGYLHGLINIRCNYSEVAKGIPQTYIEQMMLNRWVSIEDLPPHHKTIQLPPPKYREEVLCTELDFPAHHEALKEIYEMFRPSPHALAVRYAAGEQLSQFELDRILYEGTYHTVQLLLQKGSITDPILQQLAERWQMPLKIDNILI